MPRFEPFAGLRYAPGVPLHQVIAPPYDVVGEEQRAELAARHPANAIHVELPVDDPVSGIDRYTGAARLLARWEETGVLVADPAATLTVLRMREPDGTRTTGVLGALGCEPDGGDVLPHEQTIPKDTTDRLDLLRACRANLSPIWGLSLTAGLGARLEPDAAPDAEAVDDDGVLHQAWVVADPDRIDAIAEAVASSPVVIADGHHRYHTALAYRDERRAAGAGPGPWDLVLALVVELAPGAVAVGAIHRTIHGLPPDVDLPTLLGRAFELRPAGPAGEAEVAAAAEAGLLAATDGERLWLLTPRPEAVAEADSDLDASLVALAVASVPGVTTSHHHHWRSALAEVARHDADAAVVLRPVRVEQIAGWAHRRRRMPPKSTFFHPKPRTGLVFRPLR